MNILRGVEKLRLQISKGLNFWHICIPSMIILIQFLSFFRLFLFLRNLGWTSKENSEGEECFPHFPFLWCLKIRFLKEEIVIQKNVADCCPPRLTWNWIKMPHQCIHETFMYVCIYVFLNLQQCIYSQAKVIHVS